MISLKQRKVKKRESIRVQVPFLKSAVAEVEAGKFISLSFLLSSKR